MAFVCVCHQRESSMVATWVIVITSPTKAPRVTHGYHTVTLECATDSVVGFTFWSTFNAALTLLWTYEEFLVRKPVVIVTACISGAVFCVHLAESTGLVRTIWTYFLVIFYCTVRLICLLALKLFIIYFRPGKSQSHSHQRLNNNNNNFITTKPVALQLNDYLAYNGQHVPLQSPYRSYHNTKSALMRVHNDIMISLDNGTV